MKEFECPECGHQVKVWLTCTKCRVSMCNKCSYEHNCKDTKENKK
jgi:predicted RNA-binding Zn-ribbon protein involved in translation (DUF1610 family)